MKKYRCPNCKEVFYGTQEVCPKCGVKLRYAGKETEKPVEEEAVTVSNFLFSDPEVVKHEEKFVPVTSIESLDNPKDENGQDAQLGLMPGQMMRTVAQGESFYDGKALARVGVWLSSYLLAIITLGLGTMWAYARVVRWDINHTVVSGHRLKFTGKGGKLFGRFLLWILLTPLTLGIILIKVQLFLQKWKVKHTEFVD